MTGVINHSAAVMDNFCLFMDILKLFAGEQIHNRLA